MTRNPRSPQNVTISVFIATKDRPEDLKRCLLSILNNRYTRPFEIIVADQGKTHDAKGVIQLLGTNNIRYIAARKRGKAHALNRCLRAASGRLFCFTDDDCIVSPEWLSAIEKNFVKYPSVGGIFGSIFPYNPTEHPHEICPATFSLEKGQIIRNPYIVHYHSLGLGNNMSFHRKVVERVGLFQEWIGPGVSFSAGGEDSDYIYRALRSGYALRYTPDVVVYHNRWLSQHDEQLLQCRYTIGAVSFSFYHTLGDDNKIGIYIIDRIRGRIFERIRHALSLMKNFRFKDAFRHWYEPAYILCEIAGILYGMGIAVNARVRKLN